MIRRAGIRHPRAAPPATKPKRVLWVLGDTEGAVAGYSAGKIAASYSGPPDVVLVFGVGTWFGFLQDGAMVVGTAASNYWFIVPPALLACSGTVAVNTAKLKQIPGPGDAGPVLQFPNRDVLLNDDTALRVTLPQLYATSGAGGLAISGLGTNASDVHTDSASNLWCADFSANALTRYTAGTVAAAGAATADKIATGTNFNGISGVAFDAGGGAWHTSYADDVLRYHNAAVIAALNGVGSNPAVTRSITGLTGGLQSVILDLVGGAWCVGYDVGRAYYLTPAQLGAGGAQTPNRTIQTPFTSVNLVRLAPGFSPVLR